MKTFDEIAGINVSGQVEKKGKLSYLSWAYAWAEIKKIDPMAQSTVYENRDGWNYHTDGRTCWVKTGVTVNGLEHVEYLPVMDDRNQSIPADKVTSWQVNKAIQRSITKAIARHGLGLYIYAGEDLPDEHTEPAQAPKHPQDPDRPRLLAAQSKLGWDNARVKAELDKRNRSYKDTAEYLEGVVAEKEIAEACAPDEQAIIDQAARNVQKTFGGDK